MAGWTCSDNEVIEWDGSIRARRNLFVEKNLTVNGGTLFVDSVNNRVGIGTANPGAKLEVYSSLPLIRINRNASYIWDIGADDNTYSGLSDFIIRDVSISAVRLMIEATTGKVGIGTTNPQTNLDVRGSAVNPTAPSMLGSAASSALFLTHSTAGYGLLFGVLNSGTSWIQSQRVDGTAASYSLLLNARGGRVGVGTLTPQRPFVVSMGGAEGLEISPGEISGENVLVSYDRNGGSYIGNTFYALSHVFTTGGSTNKTLVLANGGNVGIGTTSPSHLLDIASQAAITSFGGFATKFKAGAIVSGGYIVAFSRTSGGYVVPCGLSDGVLGKDSPIGVIYHTTPSTAVNSDVWVVTNGKAKVVLDNAAACSYGYFLRTSDTVSGAALAASEPTVPADASHWREIGHCYGVGVSGALVECVLHFN